MPTDRTAQRYSRVAIMLHWLIAAAILFEIGLGWQTEGPRGAQLFAVFQLHKSVGITILLLSLARLSWRFGHRPPALPSTLKAWERGLAHATHWGFYVLMLGLPLSGWLMVSTAKIAVPTMLYKVVPWPHLPGTAGLELATRAALNHASELTHHMLVDAVYFLLAMHIAGALKHHFLGRDGELARMIPTPMKQMTATLAFIVVLAAGILALGNGVRLAAPGSAPAVVELPTATGGVVIKPAEPPAAPAADNANAAADEPKGPVNWTVGKPASSIGFATAWSGSPVTGRFSIWSADILFDPDALDRSSVTVTISMSSATTNSAETQEALPGDDWFAATMHPKATFTARSFRKLRSDRYEAHGTLTIRGVTKSVTLPFSLAIVGKSAKMTGSMTLDRTAFGVGQGQWSATDEVSGTVTITVKITATRP